MSIGRELKRRMRRDVHKTWNVPALYLTRQGLAPLRVDVRLHVTFEAASASGVGEGYAAIQDVTPRIKFDRSQVSVPLQGAILVVAESEAYILGSARPPDDEWITVEVAPMAEAKAKALWKLEWPELLA